MIGLVVLYVLLAKLIAWQFESTHAIGVLWLTSGVALALVLRKGYRFLGAIFLGALLGNWLIESNSLFALLDALRHTLMVFLGVWLLKREGGFDPGLSRLRDFSRILVLALGCGLFVALLGPVIEWWTSFPGNYSFYQRLAGHTLGILVTMPFVLVWRQWPRAWASPRVAAEAVLVLSLVLLAGQVVFLDGLERYAGQFALGYWHFFLITWAAIRLGPHGAVSVLMLTALQALVGAHWGLGLFALDIVQTQLLNYFFYLSSLALVGITLATYFTELKQNKTTLREEGGTVRSFVNITLDGFWRIDFQGQLLDVNPAYCQQSGYSRAELLGMHISDLESSHNVAEVALRIQTIRQNGRDQFETLHQRKDGSTWPVEVASTCLESDTSSLFVILRDISERTQRDDQLRQMQARLSLAQRASGSGMWDLDVASGRIIWSPECLSLLGLLAPSGETGLDAWLGSIHPEDRAAAQQAVQDSIQLHQSFYCEYRVALPSGEVRWIAGNGNTTYDAQGQALRMFGLCIDITPQKLAQRQLADSAAFNLAILNSLDAQIAVLDPHGVIVAVNDGWLASANSSLASRQPPPYSLIGSHYLSFAQTAADGALSAHQGINAVLAGQLPSFSLQYPCHTPTQQQWFLMNVTPLISGDRGVVVSHVNISSLKQAQAMLGESQGLLQSVVENMPVSVFWKDRESRYLGCNTQFAIDAGFSHPDEVIGKTDFEMRWKNQAETFRRDDQALLDLDKPELNVEISVTKPNGELAWRNSSKVPLRVDAQKVIGVLGIYDDITDKKRYSLELENHRHHLEELVHNRTLDLISARDAAETANRSKADFLSNMSHEIRSPLNAILGLAYLLEQAHLDLDAHTMVGKIRSSGRMLLSLIGDILDISKIEAGQMTLEQAPFPLSTVVDNLAGALGVAMADKAIELVIQPLPAGISMVMGDAMRLEQVLVNLSNNAIKFTAVGRVELHTELLWRHGEQIMLRFSVQDTGIGIAPELQSGIFSPFIQADSSTTRRFGGSGLGLAICYHLVTLMGGEIGVVSRLGVGSEFWFTLPLQRVPEEGVAAPERGGVHALIADDSEIALKAIGTIAQGLGWQVSTVNSGATALLHVQEAAHPQRPNVVVLDWKMPGMDGLVTARAIREAVPQDECPIVIMATAYSLTALEHQPGMALVDAVLQKPVTASSLYNAVMQAQRKRAVTLGLPPVIKTLESDALAHVRVLVVDDSDINREVAQRILSSHGALVLLAVDGQDAVDWLLAHPQEVDLVLMDVQMPVLDGIEATRKLRCLPQFDDLPIVALTAGAFKSQQEAAQAVGMTHFVSKPFDVPSTIALIQRLRRPSALTEAPPTHVLPPVVQAVTAPAQIGVALDAAQGLALWADIQTYREYLQLFVNDYRHAVKAMNKCLVVNKRPDAAALAHKLCGVAANLALPDTRRLAGEAERVLNTGYDPTRVLTRLDEALLLAVAAIEQFCNLTSATATALPAMADSRSTSAQVTPLLRALLAALDLDSPGAAKPHLRALEILLPVTALRAIQDAVRGFDFRGAEAATLKLVSALDISLKE